MPPANSTLPAPARSNRAVELTAEKAVALAWQSIGQTIGLAFTIWLLGGVALSIVSGFCKGMIPALPPGVNDDFRGAQTAGQWWHAFSLAAHRHSLAIIFVVLVACRTGVRLAHYSTNPRLRRLAARMVRAAHRVRGQWFSLLVKNAIGAFVAVLVMGIVQQFSWSQILWGMVVDILRPVLEAIGHLLGLEGPGLLGQWWGWYGDNQTKFLFWLFYSAGICDDLGLPNYKALARWGWRRARGYIRRRAVEATPPAQP